MSGMSGSRTMKICKRTLGEMIFANLKITDEMQLRIIYLFWKTDREFKRNLDLTKIETVLYCALVKGIALWVVMGFGEDG